MHLHNNYFNLQKKMLLDKKLHQYNFHKIADKIWKFKVKLLKNYAINIWKNWIWMTEYDKVNRDNEENNNEYIFNKN